MHYSRMYSALCKIITFLKNSIFGWIIIPILFFNNAFGLDMWIGGKWTLNRAGLFDKNGTNFSPLDLMDPITYDLNQTAYDEIKPIRLTTSFAGI